MSLRSPTEDENGGASLRTFSPDSSLPRMRESRLVFRPDESGYPLEFILSAAEGRVRRNAGGYFSYLGSSFLWIIHAQVFSKEGYSLSLGSRDCASSGSESGLDASSRKPYLISLYRSARSLIPSSSAARVWTP